MLTTSKLVAWVTSLENSDYYEYRKEFTDDDGKRYVFTQSPHLNHVWVCDELNMTIKATKR